MYYDRLCDLGIKLTRRNGREKTKCPQCSDGRKNKTDKPLSVDIGSGDYNCHNCGWKGNVRAFERKHNAKKYEKPDQNMIRSIELKERTEKYFQGRGISRGTLQKFMIFSKEEYMPQTQAPENCICFPYFRDGELINIKYRDAKKNFKMVKDAELIFYNLSAIQDRKLCIITEGEIDCMSAYEAGFGKDVDLETGEVLDEYDSSRYVALSVPNGASKGSQKLEYLDNCSDWMAVFSEIIIATDGDAAGMQLKDELIRRLGVERCKTISYPIEEVVPLENGLKRRCKDLNEVLIYLGKDVVVNVIRNAEFIPVDGIYYVDDIFESMLANFEAGIQLAPTTRFPEMDNYFRWKKGDINLCTGYGNHGKSFFLLQLMLTKSIWDGWKWAVFSPENFPANDFYDDLVEMYVGKWLDRMSKDEYIKACLFLDQHIYYVYPSDDQDMDSINEKFRHLVLKKGIDGVLLDPYNQLDNQKKPYERDDDALSVNLKTIKRFALLNNVCYNVIAHPKNPTYSEGKVLPVVDMYDIAGGAMWGNKVDQIISYYRPNFHIDKNDPTVDVHIQKLKRKRTGGKLGYFTINLNWQTKRYVDGVTMKSPCDPDWAMNSDSVDSTHLKNNGWKQMDFGDNESDKWYDKN